MHAHRQSGEMQSIGALMNHSVSTWMLILFALNSTVKAASTRRAPENFKAIQSAIDESRSGDAVLVGTGTYRGTLKLKPGVIVKSAGNDEKGKLGLKRTEATILEGGVEMAENAVLDGLTVCSSPEARWAAPRRSFLPACILK